MSEEKTALRSVMTFRLTEEQRRYVETSASLRGITPSRLLHRVLRRVIDDYLILSVLDDERERIEKAQRRERRKARETGLHEAP